MKTMRDRLIDNILKAQARLSVVAAGYAQLNDNLCSRLMSTADDEKNRRTNIFERMVLLASVVDEAEDILERARNEYRDFLYDLNMQTAEEQRAELERVMKLYEEVEI